MVILISINKYMIVDNPLFETNTPKTVEHYHFNYISNQLLFYFRCISNTFQVIPFTVHIIAAHNRFGNIALGLHDLAKRPGSLGLFRYERSVSQCRQNCVPRLRICHSHGTFVYIHWNLVWLSDGFVKK